MSETDELALPVLRDDLQLQSGPTSANGMPSWTIYDPLRGRYFRIGWAAFQMLSRWSIKSASALLEQIRNETTCLLSEQDLRDFIRFLFVNNLTVQPITTDYHAYLHQYRASHPPWYTQLVHNYLFFRIPLLRPDRFLRKTLPYLQRCFDVRVLYILLIMGLLGIYLVSRQWDVFGATFLHFFNWDGALWYGVAVVFAKLLHELGHAYSAAYYGCRVPVIGLAFMALFPMPYTDVTDAWRLTSRRQRVIIGAAGIVTELALAVFATLAWSFLPDGSLRSAAFVLASTTWVVTLTINLSPFMRFDGYYMLSDAWGIDNLQSRAFALARWRIRRLLFGNVAEKPEALPLSYENKMVVYAFITWFYRLVVFAGLALMVYQFFFKLLGLILFAVEIVWFILRPVVNELREWHKLGLGLLSVQRVSVLTGLIGFILLILVMPWNGTTRIPAVLEATRHTTLYAPEAGRVDAVMVKAEQYVDAGQVLLILKSPKLDGEIRLSEKRLDFYRLRLERAATIQEASADMRVAMQQWSAESARLSGLKKQLERLVIRAPFAGKVMDLAQALHAQRWLDTSLPLATLVAPDQAVVHAIADEDARAVLAVGQTGRFVPDDGLSRAIDIDVIEIDSFNISQLDRPYLASAFGGAVAVRKNASGKFIPTSSVFSVSLNAPAAHAPAQIQKGTAIINATPRSYVGRFVDAATALLVRESGF